MSRGLGPLQLDILDVVSENPRGLISWRELKERFPLRVHHHSLHRSVRGLIRRGRLREVWTKDNKRWLAYRRAPGTLSYEDRAFLESGSEVLRLLKLACKARRVEPPPVVEELRANMDAYRRMLQDAE
jgi:hypothetical protein